MDNSNKSMDKTDKALAVLAIMRLIEKKRKGQYAKKSSSAIAKMRAS